MNLWKRFQQVNLPNKLTLLRLLLVPVFCLFISVSRTWTQWLALLIFIAASATDLLDGYLARKNHQVTDFGKLVDPIADKCLVTAAMLFLVAQGRMNAGMCMVFIAREFIISAFRMLAASRGTVIAADKLGKYKTVAQMVAIVMLILFKPVGESPALLGNIGAIAADAVTYIALILSLVSCGDYLYKNRSIIDRQLKPEAHFS